MLNGDKDATGLLRDNNLQADVETEDLQRVSNRQVTEGTGDLLLVNSQLVAAVTDLLQANNRLEDVVTELLQDSNLLVVIGVDQNLQQVSNQRVVTRAVGDQLVSNLQIIM